MDENKSRKSKRRRWLWLVPVILVIAAVAYLRHPGTGKSRRGMAPMLPSRILV